jgi:hypothetical protein
MSSGRYEHEPVITHYPDTGCKLFPSCLSCPRPRCIHDDETPGRKCELSALDRPLLLERTLAGASVGELAKAYDVSRETIWRILRNGGPGPKTESPPQPPLFVKEGAGGSSKRGLGGVQRGVRVNP